MGGDSETAIVMTGYTGITFHLIAADARRKQDEVSVNNHIKTTIENFVRHFARLGYLVPSKHRVYVWIESPDNHGGKVQEHLDLCGMSNFVRVMKYMELDKTRNVYTKHGVCKTQKLTRQYVADLCEVIVTNRFKIAAHLHVPGTRAGAVQAMRTKFRNQLCGYVWDPTNRKFHGKHGGQQDDLDCAIMMDVTMALKTMSLNPDNDALRKQMAWSVDQV